MRKVLPRHRDASAAWHSARACRLLLALLRALWSRARFRALGQLKQGRRKGGAVLARARPIAERPSYFFFAFLAFLAAFFAFFAMV